MKWSFDDVHIGMMDEKGSSLSVRVIARGHGVSNSEWLAVAARTSELLNLVRATLVTGVTKK